MEIVLRDVRDTDLDVFFENQLDPEANWMAGFTSKDPADKAAFMAHWAKVRADAGVRIQTVVVDGVVAGSVLLHGWFGDPEVSYWFGRAFWGRGVATQALRLFLKKEHTRPLYGRVVKDNIASLRVLQKCGFVICGQDKGFANARGAEVEEWILQLGA